MGWMADETGLDKCAANYVPLTPLSHLRRAKDVFADRTAVIYGDHRATSAEYHARCPRLASALAGMGVKPGEVGFLRQIGNRHLGIDKSSPLIRFDQTRRNL